ncbi:uncharacterized protein [Panulirus ornatus]|uniref:uncharacterized protein n=1 Tax=Panulirus ornatus TaxID=150431 RepID=UPI003A87E2D2
MEGQSSVECGSQPGSDVGSDHHHGRHQRHQLGSSRQQYLDQDADHLGHDEDYLDDDDDVCADSMTADNNVNGHRRTASRADGTMNRKSNKPLMEKKRRQRINRCVNELKKLVLEGMKKDPSRYSKLEKADILEMTVRHVQALHRYEAAGGRMVGGGRLMGGEEAKYRAGFTHCATEISKYLASLDDLPHDLHKKVLTHLNAIATTVTANVNSNATSVQNSINVVPNPAPIILVLNTSAGAPAPQPPTQPIAYQESAGYSLGAQPQVTLVTTSRQSTGGLASSQQQQGGLQILPTRLNNGDLTVVLPATHQVVTQNNVRSPPSSALQASAPVLSAILTSDRNHITPSSVVQPPALSISSEDSALGTETLDMSDSDISRSGVSTPVSSMSSAGSPAPAEDAVQTSPKRAGTSRSSPTLKGQVWNSNMFREELASSSCPNRNTRRQPVLAPKPTYPAWSTCSPPSDQPSRRKKDKSPPPPPAEPQSMWRPWR